MISRKFSLLGTNGLLRHGFAMLIAFAMCGIATGQGTAESKQSPEEMIQQATKMLEEAKSLLNEKETKAESEPETDLKKNTEPATTPASSRFTKFDALMAGLSIFVLAVFVGFEVITKVPPTLHTPLMSGSNAISGITVVGALIVAARNGSLLGVLAVLFATINVIGGFWVTHRMLSMFKR